MEIRRIHSNDEPLRGEPLAAAIGSFDGLHRGHLALLSRVVAHAAGKKLVPALISFYPHPSVGLGKIDRLPLITSFSQRIRILNAIGIRQYCLIPFTPALANVSWEDFCDRFLLKHLSVRHLVLGPDARIGRGALGTAPLMQRYLSSHGCSVEVCEVVAGNGVKIASRTIRQHIVEGQIEAANDLLGRRFDLLGHVVHGDGKGHQIGFPTANLHSPSQVIPKDGVYCGYAMVNGKQYPAVCNIGVRPTVGGSRRQIEVHVPNEKLNMYQRKLAFYFVDRIREEKRFGSVDELAFQIAADISYSLKRLSREQ